MTRKTLSNVPKGGTFFLSSYMICLIKSEYDKSLKAWICRPAPDSTCEVTFNLKSSQEVTTA